MGKSLTGIERLRDIAYDGPYSGGMIHISVQRLREICEQIEREVDDISGYESDVLAFVEEKGGLDEVKKRLMPEGIRWPCFEDDEPVAFGDEVEHKEQGHRFKVDVIEFMADGWRACYEKDAVRDVYRPGERVKRPAPKVLDADMVEIHVGDTLYYTETGCKVTVRDINSDGTIELDGHENRGWRADLFTHRAPVLAADGKPLQEWETVWHVKTGREYVVVEPSYGETVVVRLAKYDDAEGEQYAPDQLTHEQPDSWERLEEDAEDIRRDIAVHLGDYSQSDFEESGDSVQNRVVDLVRRAKAVRDREIADMGGR